MYHEETIAARIEADDMGCDAGTNEKEENGYTERRKNRSLCLLTFCKVSLSM